MVPPLRHFKKRHIPSRQPSDEDEEDVFAQMLGGSKKDDQLQQQKDPAPTKPRLTLSRAGSANLQQENLRPQKSVIEIRGLDPILSSDAILQALYLDGLISRDRLSISTDPADHSIILLGVDDDSRTTVNSIIDFWDGKYIGGGHTLSMRLAGAAPAVQPLATNKKTITIQQHRIITAFVEQVILNEDNNIKNGRNFVVYAKEQLYYDARFSFLFADTSVAGLVPDASVLYAHYRQVLAHPLVGTNQYKPTMKCLGTLNAKRLVLLLQNAASRRRGDTARALGFVLEHCAEYADEVLSIVASAILTVNGSDQVSAVDKDSSDAALYVLNDLAYNMPELRARILSYLPAFQAARLEEWQRGWDSSTGTGLFEYSEYDGTEMSAVDIDFYNSLLCY